MPVIVNDSGKAISISSALSSYDVSLRTEAFLATSLDSMDSPESPLTSTTCVVCLQGETTILCLKRTIETTRDESGPFFVGSIEATTCVIALCWVKSLDSDSELKSAALASHIACLRDAKEFSNHIQSFSALIPGAGNSLDHAIEISLFGAFDPSGHESSRGIVEEIFKSVSHLNVKLMVSSVWDTNTTFDSIRRVAIPRITAAAIDVRSGKLQGSSTSSKLYQGYIPLELERRSKSTWSDEYLTLLTTCFCGDQQIESSLLSSLSADVNLNVDVKTLQWLLAMPDIDLLHKISTSPDAEESSFIHTQRKVMQFLIDRERSRQR